MFALGLKAKSGNVVYACVCVCVLVLVAIVVRGVDTYTSCCGAHILCVLACMPTYMSVYMCESACV